MPRVHKQTRQVLLNPEDDLWAMFTSAEAVFRSRFTSESGVRTTWDVDVHDEGGTSTEDTVALARQAAGASRYELESVWMSARSQTTKGARIRSVSVWATYLDKADTGIWHPNIVISVESEDESESIGLAELLLAEITHAQSNPSVAHASAVEAALPAPVAPTPAASSVEVNSAPWWNHPWTVATGSALFVGVVILILTIWLT